MLSKLTASPLKVGFLTTIDAPLLPFWIASALAHGVKDIVMICDSKLRSEKDNRIWRERTCGAFEKLDQGTASIYAFGARKLPFYCVENHNGPDSLSLIRSLGIECLLNAGTPRKLSGELISSVKHGVVNVHPGLLPKYRGCSCVEWAIFNDDQVGNTAHFMDEGYDTGPVITTESYEFPKDADYASIRVRVYREGCALAGKVLSTIQETRITPAEAIQQDASQAQYWKPIPQDIMDEMLKKVAAQSFRYQCL